MNYLSQHAIVEGKVIYLNIDDEKKEYWARIKDETMRLKTYRIPEELKIEAEEKQIMFYPDGKIDKITIKIISRNNQYINLTTKGVFGGVKLQSE